MFAEIQPADVYKQVESMRHDIDNNRVVLYTLCVLVAVQLLAKFAIFKRVIGLLRRTVKTEERTERLLALIESHGKTTDKKTNSLEESARQIQETAPQLAAATAEVVAEVKQVPKLVVEAIEEKKKTDSHHD